MLCNSWGDGKNMFDGDSVSQLRARKALPILVKKAQKRETISYKQLAAKLGLHGKRDPQNMRHVCGSISATLRCLEECWGEKIPRITNIVIRSDGKIAPLIEEQLTGDPKVQPTPELFEPIYSYPKWEEVLDAIKCFLIKR